LDRVINTNKISRQYFLIVSFSFVLFVLGNVSKSHGSTSLELYGGYQTAPHSIVNGNYSVSGNLDPFKFTAGWAGKSFKMPPYYGIRFTNWREDKGWGLEFTHSKVYADEDTLEKMGFERLEFTDGLNNLIVHRQHRLSDLTNKFRPYFGYGIGFIIPHVEFQRSMSSPLTFEYQLGGPSVAFNGGVKYPLSDRRFLFSEYRFTGSWLNVDLEDDGKLKTRILTNALNIGFGFNF
tara:strand:+ start:1712 stop:2416 length:705 start_codon:yes stop_codon:yes gene_type:complete